MVHVWEREIRRRIALGRVTMSSMSKIWRDRGITLETKVKLIKALIFPIALYGSETWVLRKGDRKRIDAFEIWCWWRLLRIPWAARKSNVDVLKMIKTKWYTWSPGCHQSAVKLLWTHSKSWWYGKRDDDRSDGRKEDDVGDSGKDGCKEFGSYWQGVDLKLKMWQTEDGVLR